MCWTDDIGDGTGRSDWSPRRDLVAASGSPLLRSQGFGGIRRSDTEYHYHDTTTSPDLMVVGPSTDGGRPVFPNVLRPLLIFFGGRFSAKSTF